MPLRTWSPFRGFLRYWRKKAANGVEVRLLYDDVGSIGFVNFGFVKKNETERNTLQGVQSRSARASNIYE